MGSFSPARRAFAFVSIFVLGMVLGWPSVNAGHQAAESYTGCLFTSGRSKGKVNKLLIGESPLSACSSRQVQIHLSGGDITDLNAGTGLAGGGDNGAVTLDVAETFRLPQGCTASDIPARSGGGWACSADETGIAATEAGRLVSRLPFGSTNLAPGGFGEEYVAMAIGVDGLPIVAYRDDADDDLDVLHCGDVACSSGNTNTSVVTDGNPGFYISIVIGAGGRPVVSYGDDTSSELNVLRCGDIACSSGNTTTIVDGGGVFGTAIAIGSDGLPIVAYHNGLVDLNVLHCGDVSCTSGNTIEPVDTTDFVGAYPSVAIGSDGLPLVSYLDVSNMNLKVAHCGDVSCSASNTLTSVDTGGDVGSYTSIAIGTDGLGVISYQDVSNGDLKVAHCGNVDCSASTTTTVDPSPDSVGHQTSIAIGADGLPVMSYSVLSPDQALKVAHCGNVACSASNTITLTIDDASSTSNTYPTSIRLGTDGLPVVGYHDGNSDLSVLHCSDPFCIPYRRPR